MILNILTAYNEINFLPLKKKWCDMNGLELYVIDNYSNDGTWEWLQDNKVMSHRIDTKGAFDLRILQKDINTTIHKIRPSWVIYNGADLFPVTKDKLCDMINKANSEGYYGIKIPWAMFYNTGEQRGTFNPFNTYFYCGFERGVAMIAKYNNQLKVSADEITLINKKVKNIDGLIINYGHTKTEAERDETYARRKLAWSRGMIKGWGVHYEGAKARNWLWDKDNLTDIRKTEFAWTIEKLNKNLKNVSILE